MDETQNRAIKKTLTIPKWLNYEAEKTGINFFQVLQFALKEKLSMTKKQS
ncbi:MAG: Phage-related protein [Candidatus Carbobacillus altaicus]|uniref:Phage-related protein n=1 Tax=Candidatus Carbonibacillus altaicus TaxID=2163959 RepID=A0A2R6XXS7_9BACL|nr:MAG: Phage-related protein [Candidatus Carbobacillus altaicus]